MDGVNMPSRDEGAMKPAAKITPIRGPLLRCMASDFRAARSQWRIGVVVCVCVAAFSLMMVVA